MSDVPEGYKMSEVGVIPKEWEVKTFGEVMTGFSSGATPYRGRQEYYKGNIRWITSGELNYNVITDTIEKITENAARNTNLKIHPKGTFLMAITGLEAEGTRGSCGIVGAGATTNQSCMALFPTKELLTEYLFHYYVNYGNSLALEYCQGTKQQSYTAKIVKILPIIVPPTIEEQQAIASALSDVHALITALEQFITKKRSIKQGAMQQLLTGKKRLPGFGGEWEANSIESLTPLNKKYGIVDGPFGSNLKTIHYRKSGIPIITSGYVTEGIFIATDYLYVDIEKFKQEKRSAVHGGDIVMAKIGARCGASAILPKNHEKGLLSGNALKITVDETKHSTYFIWQILWSIYTTGEIETLKSVGAQPAVSMPNLKKFQINLPPLPEQQAIAQILSDMDTEIEALEQKQAKYKAIKQGMMQELLTGKTRLV